MYLYHLFRSFEMKRFDGPAGGSSLTRSTHRDDIDQAAIDYETDSGSDSEADPDHYCSVPRNARGVDVKLVRNLTFIAMLRLTLFNFYTN